MAAETRLKQVRETLGYTAGGVIRMILARAERLNLSIMSPTSLKTKMSRWENGRESPGPIYRRLLREVYGRTNEELGFPPDSGEDEAEELIAQLTIAQNVDAAMVKRFSNQVEQARHVDRRLGGVGVLDQLRANIQHMEDLLRYSTMRGQREALAGVLAEASALAGWEALDRNAIRQAWDHHERAKAAAREANSSLLLAHSTAQQAFILIDLGQADAALAQLAEAREIAKHHAPALLRAWLDAAYGEGLAATGQRDDALRAFDRAASLLPNDPVDPYLPFLFLGGAHLDRWRGNALSRLGDPGAIEQLSNALPRLPAEFTRAKGFILVDLAHAHAAAGDRDAALQYSREARRLAMQIKSDRQLRRLNGLILPGSAHAA